MIDPIYRKYNLENLKYVSSKIAHLEHFLFFGTLLGYKRYKNILEKDDDIDFYVNLSHREELSKILTDSDLHIRINTLYFIQGTRLINGIRTYVDFYLYENNPDKDYILERWNIEGNIQNPTTHLHVAKDLVFPTKSGKMGNIDVKLPNKIDDCCRYLYGEHYETPLEKKVQYVHKVMHNKPIVFILG